VGCALAIALSFGRANGQSGTIVYEWVALLDVEVTGVMAAVRTVWERQSGPRFILHFTPSRSLMARDSLNRTTDVSPISFRVNDTNLNALVAILDAWYSVEPNVLHEAYVHENGASVKVLRASDEKHRIEPGAPRVEWTITDEQKEHLGYPVNVAVGEVGGERVEAWFAPGIPVSSGPAAYGGLPGMILMLSLDAGRITYAATEISLGAVDEALIRMPVVGEVRSEEAYRSIARGEVRKIARHYRRMVDAYGNVRCIVGMQPADAPGRVMLQCMQSRGASFR